MDTPTVKVHVLGGIVQDVETDGDVIVDVLDYDNDGCECAPPNVHSHETYGPKEVPA